MYDINFFSVYKKKSSKNNGFKIFLIVFILLFVMSNAILIAGGLFVFKNLETKIAEKNDFINSPATKDKIAAAARIKQEAALTSDYLTLLNQATDNLKKMNVLNSGLLNKIRQLAPTNTKFTFTDYTGISIKLACISNLITDPMDMYHAFRNDSAFANVVLDEINVSADSTIVFNLTFQIAGGESK